MIRLNLNQNQRDASRKDSMFRRHPILVVFGLLLLGMLAAVAVFVFTFDLNTYRERLEHELSRALQTSVTSSDARLTLHQGIALDFRQIRLGDEESNLTASAEHLFLQLDLLPLLRRRISIAAAELMQPHIVVRALPQVESAPAATRWTQEFQIRRLKIRDGRLTWHGAQEQEAPIAFQDIDLDLEGLTSGRSLQFHLSAALMQKERAAALRLSGNLTPAAGLADWQHWEIKAKIDVEDLAATQLPIAPFGPDRDWAVSGRGSVNLEILGKAASGLHLDARLRGDGLQLVRAEHILAVQGAGLRAVWRHQEADWWLTLQQVKLNQWRLEGPLEIAGGQQPLMFQGQVSAPPLAAEEILPWVSAALPDFAPQTQNLKVTKGTLHLKKLSLSGEPPSDPRNWLAEEGPIKDFDLEITEADLDLAQGKIRAATTRLNFAQNRLEVGAGELLWEGVPLRFSGYITAPREPEAQVFLEIESSVDATHLIDLIPAAPAQLKAQGPLSLRLEITGNPQTPTFSLKADLASTDLSYASQLSKRAGLAAHLSADGRWQAPRLIIDEAQGQLGPLRFSLTGEFEPGADRRYDLHLNLTQIELNDLGELSPPVKQAKLGGKITGTLSLEGGAGQLRRREAEFTLSDGRASFGGVVGDLNQAQGRILVSGTELRIPQMSARLGESAMQLRARIPNLSEPRLQIHLEGRDLRPQDLIFPGEGGRFVSVAGGLIIDGQEVVFDSISAETAGGTLAVVSGAVTNFNRPQVNLKILAEYGNVDEILEFFRSPAKQEPPVAREGRIRVRIEVEAARGQFHNLDFVDGRAVISYHNRVLDVYPLRADLAPGYYVGRVVWSGGQDGQAPRLRVSGSVLEGDAEALHRSQTQLRGLISGKLRGAFYLEGAGNNFWPSARGGLNIEVREGTLYRFPVLSKIFSLLNVSQIFTFRLPDMSREGMPFNTLSANLVLRDGRLNTEDLLIDSNAMNLSLVGEVNLVEDTIDAVIGLKPLRTVDRIVTKIPIAGWLLAGEEEALVTVHFRVQGPRSDPGVTAVPITSLSEKVFGIFRRVLGLPGKMVTDFERIFDAETNNAAPTSAP
ncbi:AsmA-like C-terminal region [Geoalkalibacter ferrihydriticus]|uniref:YhdP central domain-containing protein n=3 Tax=Geoalkalibacter ferrihydriticus TaxID=392333 RepID=A0A0C2HW99_9BACT|nr:hypothetical protein GFER_08430 [Geoalkalibacter ferrihydriticus DSM 17813]SDL36992.1 AsmA-like C-terminal region [Geoalkalibacter ferrihydriticus]